MTRMCTRLAAIILALQSSAVLADEPWPAVNPEWTTRGAGGGIGIFPVLFWWCWIAVWAVTSDWIHHDSVRRKIRPEWWTAWAIFPFAVCSLLVWFIPAASLVASLVGHVLMALAWLVPLYAYGLVLNPKVPDSEKIFTVGHFKRLCLAALRKMGFKVAAKEQPSDGLPQVMLVSTSAATPEENRARLVETAKMPGHAVATKMMQEAVAARATTLLLEPTQAGLAVRHDVDGVVGAARLSKPGKGFGKSKQPDSWEDSPPLDATMGGAVVAVLKSIAAADAANRAAAFALDVNGKKRPCRLVTRATKTAKQVAVEYETPPPVFKKLEDIGLPDATANRVRELIALENGLFVVSSPPASGCTTTFDMVLQTADRLLRDFISIEDVAAPGKEIQNVKQVRYNAANGETAVAVLKQAMLEYPRAVVTRDLTDAALAAALVELADSEQLVIVSVRAADAIDAIQKLLALGIDREKLAHCLLGSLSGRLVRQLCTKCSEPVATTAEMQKWLGRTAEEAPEIRRPSSVGGCRACAGRMYVGRTAIFELASGPTLRQAIAQQGDATALRKAALRDGMKSLSDAGRALIAAQASSQEELQRAFAVKKEAGPAGAKR
jgi:type II secretory ATPase GspE/PulE/Tfp pilus assembly ATPase PilB-like protein